MKSSKNVWYVFVGLIFLISACQDEKENYSGVSELISDRNKARYAATKNTSKKSVTPKKTTSTPGTSERESIEKKAAVSSIILYEEKIEIVGAESRRTLAKGVASINKMGQIVRIKIVKE